MDTKKESSGRSAPKVLLIGSEEILLSTRKSILERQGLIVTTMAPGEAEGPMRSGAPDLVIVCHTVDALEASRIGAVAAGMPSPPSLLRFVRIGCSPEVPGYDLVIDSGSSAATFVSAVGSLVPLGR